MIIVIRAEGSSSDTNEMYLGQDHVHVQVGDYVAGFGPIVRRLWTYEKKSHGMSGVKLVLTYRAAD